jgi:hypothetical protein
VQGRRSRRGGASWLASIQQRDRRCQRQGIGEGSNVKFGAQIGKSCSRATVSTKNRVYRFVPSLSLELLVEDDSERIVGVRVEDIEWPYPVLDASH